MSSSEVQIEIDAAASIIGQIATESGSQVGRSAIRRAIEEAAVAWPGDPSERWWKWIVEASETLGIKSKVVDCTFQQAVSVARDGGHVIARLQSNSQWVAATAGRGRKILNYRAGERLTQLSVRKFERLFGGETDQLRAVVMEPKPDSFSNSDQNPVLNPLDRLRSLLNAESSDIWIVFVFALVNGVLMLATPLAVESLVTTVAFGRQMQPVVVLAVILFGFLAFSAALRALQSLVAEIIQQRLFTRIVADLAYRLPRVKFEALEGQHGPELLNRFFDVVTVQKVVAQLLLDGISLVLGTVIGMAVLAFYHPWLLGFDVVLIAMIAFVVFVLGRGAVSSSMKESKTKYKTAAFLEDLASYAVTFKAGGASDYAMERADQLTCEYLNTRRRHFRILMRQIIFALGLQAIASTALLGLGGWLVISGELTLGQLVAAELIVTIIVGSFAKIGKHLESFYDLLASVDKLGVLFDLPMESSNGILNAGNHQSAEVELKGLAYTSPTGLSVLETVDCVVRPGERCFIEGPTGSGKSALLDLIYRLRKPTHGHLTINGIDTRDMRPNILRRQVSLLRNIEVFEGTISENVHLDRPEISKSDVTKALEDVGLLDDVLELPDGLKTRLVSGGFPMSRSQACKLVLARAMAGHPGLLLIDGLLDVLSDEQSDELMQTICDAKRSWTVILVTGRRTLNQYATMRLSLSKTRIAAHGSQEVSHAH